MSFIKKFKYNLFIHKVFVLIGGSPESLRKLSERVSHRNCYKFNLHFTQVLRDIHCISGV